jgi:uncharacterized protein YjbI with pentapeptide repeats
VNPPRLASTLATIDAALHEESEWSEAEVSGDFSGIDGGHAEIAGCRVANARFTGTDLTHARIVDTVFTGCDLSAARLDEARLTRVELRDCRLSGFLLGGATMQDVRFVDCKADNGHFRLSTGERVAFEATVLTGADFGGCRIAQAQFFDCDLTGADFSGARIKGARLHGSTLEDLRGALDLKGVVIDANQVVPLGVRVLAALGVGVDEEREP